MGMTVDGERFITEMLRAMRAEMSEMRGELVNVALRQTALEQRMMGMDTHLIALQHGLDGVISAVRRIKGRLELVEE